jgi:uncharacterized membrane protein YGL010W
MMKYRYSTFKIRYSKLNTQYIVAKTKVTKAPAKPAVPAGVGFYFDKFAAAHQEPSNKIIHLIFIPLLLFSLVGLFWSIPFPQIKFLGAYNQDFNWSSFFLAFLVYYYIRLSPTLAYPMLFIMLIMFYIVTKMDEAQKAGGVAVWMVCGVIFLISVIALYAGYKKEGKRLSFEYRRKNLLIAPLFLLSLIYKRFGIKY